MLEAFVIQFKLNKHGLQVWAITSLSHDSSLPLNGHDNLLKTDTSYARAAHSPVSSFLSDYEKKRKELRM